MKEVQALEIKHYLFEAHIFWYTGNMPVQMIILYVVYR